MRGAMSLVRLAVLVVGLAGAVCLVLSNPTMDDYVQFVERELNGALDRMDQRTPVREQDLIRQVLRSQGKKLIEGIVRPSTVRHNWGLLSRYETKVAETRLVVLGIGGQFIPIKGVDEATLKIERMAF